MLADYNIDAARSLRARVRDLAMAASYHGYIDHSTLRDVVNQAGMFASMPTCPWPDASRAPDHFEVYAWCVPVALFLDFAIGLYERTQAQAGG